MSRSGSRTVRFAGRMRTTNNQLPSLNKNQRQTDLVLADLRRLSTVTIISCYRNYPICCCRGTILAGGAERRFRRGGVGATVLFSVLWKEAQA